MRAWQALCQAIFAVQRIHLSRMNGVRGSVRHERSLEWTDGPALSRRELLRRSGGGFAALALAGPPGRGVAGRPRLIPAIRSRPGRRHFPARAKRVIFLFMHGGPSQVDTFDYKPLLERDHGKPLPFAKPRVVSGKTGNLLRSPFKFQQYGQSGIAVSELFPYLAG